MFQQIALTSSVLKIIAYVFMRIISWQFQFTQNRIFAGCVANTALKVLFQKSMFQVFQSHLFNCQLSCHPIKTPLSFSSNSLKEIYQVIKPV